MVPSSRTNTRALLIHASPHRRRSSSCLARWARRAATVTGSRPIVRRLLVVYVSATSVGVRPGRTRGGQPRGCGRAASRHARACRRSAGSPGRSSARRPATVAARFAARRSERRHACLLARGTAADSRAAAARLPAVSPPVRVHLSPARPLPESRRRAQCGERILPWWALQYKSRRVVSLTLQRVQGRLDSDRLTCQQVWGC